MFCFKFVNVQLGILGFYICAAISNKHLHSVKPAQQPTHVSTRVSYAATASQPTFLVLLPDVM